jgi:hypothetical protein
MWIDMDLLAFIVHFSSQFWIASRLVCNLCDAMAGSLSVSGTAISLAKVAVIDSNEVGRCKAGTIMALRHFLGVCPH